MSEPIIEFKTQKELDACLAEWQERLFLSDWIIKAKVEHVDVEGLDVVGYCEDAPTIKSAIISITPAGEIPKDAIVKSCAEKTLVHELLHCRFLQYEMQFPKTLEAVKYENDQHAMIEMMAKSFIMAKYGISHEWFRNF